MARTDDVVETIKGMILDGELKPGDRLPVEPELAAQLDVSRGSLREGVRALVAMGILEARQGAGTYVTSLELPLLFAPLGFVADMHAHEPVEFLQVRRTLEAEAAARAAGRITPERLAEADDVLKAAEALWSAPGAVDHDEMLALDRAFHRIVAEASGNAVLAALLEVLAGRTTPTRIWRSHAEPEAGLRAIREHRAIWSALERHDVDRARVEMVFHLLGVEDFVREHAADVPPA